MKKILLLTSISLLLASPAMARTVTVQKQAALNGQKPISLHINGGGVNLDFSQLNERIVEIILDDMSRVGYSHCLLTKSCGDLGMPNIHLRRIKTVDIPGVYQTKSTLLTVNTVGRGNRWNTYIFPIALGEGSAPYNKVSVLPTVEPVAKSIREKRPLGTERLLKKPKTTTPVNLELQHKLADQQEGLLNDIKEFEEQLEKFEKQRERFEKDQKKLKKQLEKLDQKTVESAPVVEEDSKDLFHNPAPLTEPPPSDPTIDPKPVHEADVPVQLASTMMADPATSERQPVVFSIPKRSLDNALTMGLSLERRNGKVSWWETRQINTAIILLRRGRSLESASKQSGVSDERLAQLIRAGGGDL